MYTGPCFVKYNTVLRGLQSSISFFKNKFIELCSGNKYTTTLHVINSSCVKLSKLTYAAKVYRGVSGGRLPKNFRLANEYVHLPASPRISHISPHLPTSQIPPPPFHGLLSSSIATFDTGTGCAAASTQLSCRRPSTGRWR